MDSTRANVNGALSYSMRTTTVPKEEDTLNELLKSRSKEGFAASAYWGATGEVPPREPDDVTGKNPYRFKEEISRKLVPFPKDATSFPKTVDYSLTGFHLLKDSRRVVETGPGMNENQMRQLLAATGEDGPDLSKKPRFLYLQTTMQRMPGKFDDDVLKTLRDGQGQEDDLARRIGELQGAPLSSGPPDPYRLTSDDYCDMAEINPSSWRVQETDLEDPDTTLGVYRSRYNNVEREGPKRRAHTSRVLQREHEVDSATLRDTLDASRKDTLATGYKPWSAKEWMSTTHREHAQYDVDGAVAMNDRNATLPMRNVNYQLTAQHEASVVQRDARTLSRHDGEWGTEYSDGYQDRFDRAEVEKQHGHRNVFDIVKGIYTMEHQYHHPRDDTSRGEFYTPSQLVPGQFVPMSREPLHAPNELDTTSGK